MKFRHIPTLLALPILLSGCVTEAVLHEAFNGSTAFLRDKIKRVDSAFVTPERQLVIFLEGKRAESPTNGPFTMTSWLPAETERSWTLVPREEVTAGWDSVWMRRTDLVAVTIAPPVSVTREEAPGSPAISGADRVLYPIKETWANASFWYVVTSAVPKKCDVVVQCGEVRSAHRYPFLLLIPLTIPVDIVLLPYEVYGMLTFGDRVARPIDASAANKLPTTPR